MLKQTLHLTKPFGQILILMLPILGLLLVVGEIIVRQPLVHMNLKTPSLNSRHYHIERQWYRLEALKESGIEIQCIALGNSMVVYSFDPFIFSEAFKRESGIDYLCFNFGIDALTPVSAAALAQILVDSYHPRLLIFGTDSRDFAIDRNSEETTVIYDMAWVQYRLGKFNLEGWLLDHSYLYRYRNSLVELMHLLKKNIEPMTNQYGSEPQDIIGSISTPPDPADNSFHVQYYFQVLGNYSIKPENRIALSQILDQKENGLTVILVEMPVPDTYFVFFDNPEDDYQTFMNTMREISSKKEVYFLETTRYRIIPDDGWMDYTHVNRKEAQLFSKWLGEKLGKAVSNGQITGLTP